MHFIKLYSLSNKPSLNMEEGGNFMKKRKVINTSTGGLDYYPFSHDIEILRIKVSIHGQEYQDGLTLKADEFYQKLNEDRNLLPKTSHVFNTEFIC